MNLKHIFMGVTLSAVMLPVSLMADEKEPLVAEPAVKFIVRGGDAPAATIRAVAANTTALLTEFNKAFNENRALNLSGIAMSDEAFEGINSLWEYAHFFCDDGYVQQPVVNLAAGGYSVRQIPIMLNDPALSGEDAFKEGSITFDAQGRIARFNFMLPTTTTAGVLERAKDVTDEARRLEILSYVEHLRTAYCEKDIDFLEQVYSDDALIITGTVIKQKKDDNSVIKIEPKVKYTQYTKRQYIDDQKKKFAANKWINVDYSDITIKRHPALSMQDFYCVQLVQDYANATGYKDQGYLFLLWDFRDPDQVQIHVRTWQPKWLDDNHTQELPKEEIYSYKDVPAIDL